jgi:hypothetical protein
MRQRRRRRRKCKKMKRRKMREKGVWGAAQIRILREKISSRRVTAGQVLAMLITAGAMALVAQASLETCRRVQMLPSNHQEQQQQQGGQ